MGPAVCVAVTAGPPARPGAGTTDGGPAQPRRLGFGYGPVSLVLAVLIVGFVAYLASSRIDVARVETAGQ